MNKKIKGYKNNRFDLVGRIPFSIIVTTTKAKIGVFYATEKQQIENG
jgi:hypothetical protein